ncbi:MAG: type II secretion system F family protein [Gemmatimonadaceae bacterium]|nr:type II secretion system F family protein [Gemmatimonadaceae bacterium]
MSPPGAGLSNDSRMMHEGFAFSAAAADGRLEQGWMAATSREAAAEQLARKGLLAVRLTAARGDGAQRHAADHAELALVLRMLSDLLGAGLPAARALAAMEGLAPDRWRAALPGVTQSVREGQSLARALADAPLAIPPMVTGILQAGERGGGLAAALGHAAEICEDHAATRAAIRSALAYPTVLGISGSAAVGLLVAVVLPKFAAILGELGQSLPPATRFVLDVATVTRTAAIPGALVVLLAIVIWRVVTSRPDGLRQWHALLLRLPVVGPIRHASATARVCVALSALLESGVPIAPALAHAGAAADDRELSARLASVRQDVEHGERLSGALQKRKAFTDVARQLIQAGESAGTVPSLLRHAARIERDRTVRHTRAAVALVEPVLILTFGAIVAIVAGALLQALYSVRP